MDLHGQSFALERYPHYSCNGRTCVACGKCCDWLYSGDHDSWNWIRNVTNWNKTDEQRWQVQQIWTRFVPRHGATCRARYGICEQIDVPRTTIFDADDNYDKYHIVHYNGHGFCVICLCKG